MRHQGEDLRHVLRMQGSPPEREILAYDPRVVEVGDDTIGHPGGEWQPGVEPPGSCYNSRGIRGRSLRRTGCAGAGAVDDVYRIVLMVIHFRFSIDAITALAARLPGSLTDVSSRDSLACRLVPAPIAVRKASHCRAIILSKLTDLPVTQMLNAAFNLFLLAGVERTSVRAAEIAADPSGDRHPGGIVVATFRAGKAFTGTFELAGKAALIALIDRRVGTVIGDMLVAVIPDIFQRFQVVLDIRVFAVANEAPLASGGYGASKSILSYGLTFSRHRGGSCWCSSPYRSRPQ